MRNNKNINPELLNSRIYLTALLIFFVSLYSRQVCAQSWSSIGGGMNDWVYASTIYNGDLIVGGKFTTAGGVSADHVARWNGTAWEPLGLGVNGKVNALIEYNGNLVAAGEFTSAGGLDANFIAQWDGTSWNDELGGVGSTVTSLAVIGSDLFVGGYFTEADNIPVNYIAKRNDAGWSALGSGVVGVEGQVMALTVHNGELYAGGFFTSAGGIVANHIAKWNGTSWSALGNGIGGIVYTLAEYNGNLVAGGLFLSAGTISANHIASWDGSSWSTFGSGMAGTFYQYVFALAVYNGNLVAGGYFTSSGGVSTNGIAQWNGTDWSGMNGGLFYPGNVYGTHTLCNYGPDLIAGGLFYSAGTTAADNIAVWNEPVNSTRTLNLTALVEGFYNTETGFMNQAQNIDIDGIPYNNFPGSIVDTLSVILAAPDSPWNYVLQENGVNLNTDGSLSIAIPLSLNGSYYIVIKHRNSIETWSAEPVLMSGGVVNYDFTDSASKAYGNNMLLTTDGRYVIYGGDVFRDDAVDTGDMTPVDNDGSAYTAGYLTTDVNGDGIVDSADMTTVDNNSGNFVGAMHP